MTILRAITMALALSLCAGPARAQSVASLFTSLPADFAHLFTPANGIIAGVGGAASAAVHPKDDDIALNLRAETGGREHFFEAGSPMGDGTTQGAFALGMYIVG